MRFEKNALASATRPFLNAFRAIFAITSQLIKSHRLILMRKVIFACLFITMSVFCKPAHIISENLPDGFVPYSPARQLQMTKLAISANYPNSIFAAYPRKLQAALREAWGMDVPIVDSHKANGVTMLLVGNAYSNELANRLTVLGMLGAEKTPEGELRTIPGSPDGRPDALFIGGPTPEAVDAMLADFLRRYPSAVDVIPYFSHCPSLSQERSTPEMRKSKLDALYARGPASEGMVNSVLTTLQFISMDYLLTGNDAYARLFGDEIIRLRERYFSMLGNRGNSPHFTFYVFPSSVDVIEESPAFTDSDQRNAAELCRLIGEHIMTNGDLSIPRRLFDSDTYAYMTNHPVNGILSMYFAGEFLWSRYRFPPAQYWMEMAEHGFRCISQYIFGPEDSLAYQTFNITLLMRYIVGSGKNSYVFFNTQEMQDYLAYNKAMMAPTGELASFGDAYPVESTTGFGHYRRMMMQCHQAFGDADSAFYLNRLQEFNNGLMKNPPAKISFGEIPDTPKGKTTGLLLFPVRPYKFELLKMNNCHERSVLDKAAFRSSWDAATATYCFITGINGGPHGHYDASSICAYVVRGEEWLADRDYVKSYAADHNRISVLFNGQATEWFAKRLEHDFKGYFSQILGHAESADHKRALLSLLIEDTNHCDRRRDIFIDESLGLFVIDRITAREPGTFLAENRFHVLGAPQPSKRPNDFPFTRKTGEFHIVTADDGKSDIHSTFETGSNARDTGYYGCYRDFGGQNTAHWTARQERALKPGEALVFATHLHAGESVPFHRLASNIWRLETESPLLIGYGKHTLGGCSIDADFFVITPDDFFAIHPRSGETLTPSQRAAIIAALPAASSSPQRASVPYCAPFEQRSYPAPVTALASHGDELAVGLEDGTIAFRGQSIQLNGRITALAVVPDGHNGINLAVGLSPQDAKAPCLAMLFSPELQKLWETRTIEYQNQRPGVVSITSAKVKKDAPPAILFGTQAWMYMLLDQTNGKLIQRFNVLHKATNAAVGDFDGDGLDDFLCGCEYFSSFLYTSNGHKLASISLVPEALYQLATDFGGNGKVDFFSLRSNGMIYRYQHKVGNRHFDGVPANMGGHPAGGVLLHNKLYSLSTSGILCVTDAQETRQVASIHQNAMALEAGAESLFAAGMDGFILKLAPDGRLVTRYAFPIAPADTHPILHAPTAKGAAFSAGNTITIVE